MTTNAALKEIQKSGKITDDYTLIDSEYFWGIWLPETYGRYALSVGLDDLKNLAWWENEFLKSNRLVKYHDFVFDDCGVWVALVNKRGFKQFQKKFPEMVIDESNLSEFADDPKETFADRLRKERKKRGYTQQEMAAKIGIKRNNYTLIESGHRNPTIKTLAALAVFGIDLNYLLTGENSLKKKRI